MLQMEAKRPKNATLDAIPNRNINAVVFNYVDMV